MADNGLKPKILARLAQLKSERESWYRHWQDLSDYYLPRRARFLTTDRNKGSKRNSKILDSTPTLAARSLAGGLMSGITSPARPWFRLTTPDPAMMDDWGVRSWLFMVEERMRDLFQRSNLYDALPNLYLDIGVFGTGVMLVEEDPKDIIRCYSLPIGSYFLGNSARLAIDSLYREFEMTAGQLVERFGEDAVSEQVKTAYRNKQKDSWFKVIHAIEPNPDGVPGALGPRGYLWRSVYLEASTNEDKFLLISGYYEFPVIAARWTTIGEDVYGTGPGMEALPDVLALNVMQKRKAQAVEKMVNPPMNVDPGAVSKDISLLPGAINFVPMGQGNPGMAPSHPINLPIQHLSEEIINHQERIRRAFYEDVLLMMAYSSSRNMTAREVEERHEEKLLLLGPVLERLNDEGLSPLIERAFAVMHRQGLIPPPPEQMQGMQLSVEFISMLAQAQKAVHVAPIERFLNTAAFLGQMDPQSNDKVNGDEALDEIHRLLGVNPAVIRSDEEVAQIRQQRAQREQAANAIAAAQGVAKAAKDAASTQMTDDTALSQIVQNMRPF